MDLKQTFSRADASKQELICPFCGLTEFDAWGLKLHLIQWCENYKSISVPKQEGAHNDVSSLR
jgi:hypothetical protein